MGDVAVPMDTILQLRLLWSYLQSFVLVVPGSSSRYPLPRSPSCHLPNLGCICSRERELKGLAGLEVTVLSGW